jgi:TonB-dependent Receptor Plug Domain
MTRMVRGDATAESSNSPRKNVQDVTVVSTFSGDVLREMDIVDPRQLTQLVPNLYVDQSLPNGVTHVSNRGLRGTDFSLGASALVASYIDGVHPASQSGLATQICDLNCIEVLRGPQGTLFAKNNHCGSLNSAKPPRRNEKDSAKVGGGGGDNFTPCSLERAVQRVPSDALATFVSIRVDQRNECIEKLFDDGKLCHLTDLNRRVQLAWTPDRTTSIIG